MAMIHGVVMIVSPDHVGSAPVGETEIFFFDGREPAERYAARCNAHRSATMLPFTIRYEVREYDEADPTRPPTVRMRHETKAASEKPEQVVPIVLGGEG